MVAPTVYLVLSAGSVAEVFEFLMEIPPYGEWGDRLQPWLYRPLVPRGLPHPADFSAGDFLLRLSVIPMVTLIIGIPIGVFVITWIWFGHRERRA